MAEERILEKIQKCFAMAGSADYNPLEAANALRQAQALMRKHNVTEAEIAAIGYGEQKISLPIQCGKKHPMHVSRLNALVRKAFGVATVIEHEKRVSDFSYAIRFFGPKHRVELAAYSYAVMFREVNKGWTRHLNDYPLLAGVRGARMSFMVGWIEAVDETIVDFGMNKEEEAGTDAKKLEFYGHDLRTVNANRMALYGSVLEAGNAAGSGFRLHRPMHGQENKKLSA